MYKVFFNERQIRICLKEKIAKNKPYVSFNALTTSNDIKKWFDSFRNDELMEISLTHPDPDLFFKIFRSAFREIPAAGGLVISGKMVLFIFRNGKWDLPKGKIDPGEKPEQAAIREVSEECGISGHEAVRQLLSTYHIYGSPSVDSKETWIFKETFWYEMSYSGPLTGTPQKGEGISGVRWIPDYRINEVFANTYENLKLLLTSEFDEIRY
jgi:8-oxo-dGTP pyrophosphatase MutT (NUDIX family)